MQRATSEDVTLHKARVRNAWIAIGIGIVCTACLLLLWTGFFLKVSSNPYDFLDIFTLPDTPSGIASIGDKVVLFSERIDFKYLDEDGDSSRRMMMREFDGREFFELRYVRPFYSLEETGDMLFVFDEGLYRTYDGRYWDEVRIPAIGNEPVAAVDGEHIWVLSENESGPSLISIRGEQVEPIPFPFKDESDLSDKGLSVVAFKGFLHLIEDTPNGLKDYIYDNGEWTGPLFIDASTRFRLLVEGDRLYLFFVLQDRSIKETSFNGSQWSTPRDTGILGAVINTFHPVVYKGRKMMYVGGLWSASLLVFNDAGQVVESFRTGDRTLTDSLIRIAMLVGVLFFCVSVFMLVLSVIVDRFKFRPGADLTRNSFEYASLFRRFLAHAIDSLVLILPYIILNLYVFEETYRDPDVSRFMIWFFILLAGGVPVIFLYYSLFEGLLGRTPGKLICRIRVLKADLSRCGVGAAMLRTLLRIADGMFFYLVGAVTIGATLKWQRVGDLAASTVVVRDRGRRRGRGSMEEHGTVDAIRER